MCRMFSVLLSSEWSYVLLLQAGENHWPLFQKALITSYNLKYYTVTTHKHTLRKNKLKTKVILLLFYSSGASYHWLFDSLKNCFTFTSHKIQNSKLLYSKFCLSNKEKLSSHTGTEYSLATRWLENISSCKKCWRFIFLPWYGHPGLLTSSK